METNVFNRNTNERVYTEYYDDEQIKIKMIRHIKGRMNHGPYKDFYESGAKRTDATYKNGKFHGLYTFYHENGQIYVQVNYKRGNINGDVSFFDDQGQLIEVVKYKNGKPINEGK
jgi:antitoxin component YwqK of YwqJK toxin-antitoxin module